MVPSKEEKAFNEFQNMVLENDVFDSKTTIILHLATVIAVGCYP